MDPLAFRFPRFYETSHNLTLPGRLFASAILTFSFQIEPATAGVMNAGIGGLLSTPTR